MSEEEATKFLKEFEQKKDEAHYLARFKTSVPLSVSQPELFDKAVEAKIVLGIFKWQRPYEDILRIYPNISREKYNKYRKKYNLKNRA